MNVDRPRGRGSSRSPRPLPTARGDYRSRGSAPLGPSSLLKEVHTGLTEVHSVDVIDRDLRAENVFRLLRRIGGRFSAREVRPSSGRGRLAWL